MQIDDDRRLDSAVSLGIITAAQAAEIRALTPVRAAAIRAPRAVGAETIGYVLGAITVSWVWLICTSLSVAVAYEVSRRQGEDQDFAVWLHLVGAFSAAVASVMLINQVEWYRHLSSSPHSASA